MKNKELTIMDLIVEAHIGLERQGPGSAEMTLKALSFIDDPEKIAKAADLGCGTGGQTMALAQEIKGDIIGVDMFAEFIDVFNSNAAELGLSGRVKGIVGNIEELPFQKEDFDLLWCEGVIDGIGFDERMLYWNSFLKQGGMSYSAVPLGLLRNAPTTS